MAFVAEVPIPIPIQMPRIQCRGLQMAEIFKSTYFEEHLLLKMFSKIKIKN